MTEMIEYLKQLGNVPIVTIPFGAIVGSIVAFVLSRWSKRAQDNQTTSQVLSYINLEIRDNFENKIKSEYPYTELSVKGFDLINIQAGNLRINETQINEINKIYMMFTDINKKIKNIRDLELSRQPNIVYSSLPQSISLERKASNALKKVQDNCYLITGNYLKKYYGYKS